MTRRRSTFPAGQPADPDELQVEFNRRVCVVLDRFIGEFHPDQRSLVGMRWSLLPELGRGLSPGLSTHQVVTVRLPTDRLIDDVVLTSARESRSTPHGDSR